MKYLIKESQYNNAINKFISHQFEPHKEKRTREYPNSIFWLKDGEIIAQIENPDYFWINPQIWTNIMSMFSLKHTETRQVIKDWLEEHYKLGELKPFTKYTLVVIGLEEH